jgi:UDP-N-acetylglucosamine 2-epimerase (non-hydrolysing)
MSKLKLITVLGTRPEIIRLAEIIKLADQVFDHVLVHTGQNYDYNLNKIFFEDLNLREPNYYLDVVGKNLGETIGNVISKTFEVFINEKPDALLVLGDTNSVLCTIAAKRLKIPIFHMEAGNRCFDQNVPEEINRKISDHISDINLAYTEHSRRYLISEGFRKDHIFITGSPLCEVFKKNTERIRNSIILEKLNLLKNNYIVVSTHREENIDLKDNFITLCNSLNAVAIKYNKLIIFSTHPRTLKKIKELGIVFHSNIINIEPLGFIDYVVLQKNSFIVLSDSGTISEEASILGFDAVSIRTSTERPEAIDSGTIILGGISEDSIVNAIEIVKATSVNQKGSCNRIPFEYQIDNTSEIVIKAIQSYTNIVNKVIWDK